MMLPLKRVRDYEDLGMGLFIHWGLYSYLEQGEWTEYIHKLDKDKYEKIEEKFDASKFDADKIVKAAKNMGAKYIVLTTKHHEGFFLYDTLGLSNFDAKHCKAHRDLVREFVDACNRERIKPFFYIATYDWHSELYRSNFEEYLKYLQKSVEILCKNYGEVGGFWFDGNWDKADADWKLDELYGMIRKYQPNSIIINNTGLENRGKAINSEIDAVTYERGNPESINHESNFKKYVAGEISLTMNKHWGYAKNDINFVSPQNLIESICDARYVGANILINTGLMGDGSIPVLDYEYMKLIGKWFAQYGEAIYGYKTSEDIKSSYNSRDFALVGENCVYLFIYDLQNVGNKNVVLGGEGINPRSFIGFNNEIKSIKWMDNKESLDFIQNSNMITLDATGFPYGINYVVRIAKAEF